MTNLKLQKIKAASYLLQDPGGEVVRELLEEISFSTVEQKELEDWAHRLIQDATTAGREWELFCKHFYGRRIG